MKLSLLVSSPPSQSTAARMRIWRSLKSNGAAALRDGVYLLPAIHAEKFDTVIDDHFNENGHAYIFHAEAPAHLDLGQLFDRSGEYEELRTEINGEMDGNALDDKSKNKSNSKPNSGKNGKSLGIIIKSTFLKKKKTVGC